MRQKRDGARDNDVRSVSSIFRLRKGSGPRHIELCGALFVTTNAALVRITRGFFREECRSYNNDSTVPIAMSADTLATLAWLKEPLLSPDLPRKRIIADCYVALNPSDGLWRSYLEEIARLEDDGQVSDEDYALLRYSTTARSVLMENTLGREEDFKVEQVAEVLRRSREEIEAPVLRELAGAEDRLLEANKEREFLVLEADEQARQLAKIQSDLQAATDAAGAERLTAAGARDERDRLKAERTRWIERVSAAAGRCAFVAVWVVLALAALTSAVLGLGGVFSIEWLPKVGKALGGILLGVLIVVGVVVSLLDVISGWSIQRTARAISSFVADRCRRMLDRALPSG